MKKAQGLALRASSEHLFGKLAVIVDYYVFFVGVVAVESGCGDFRTGSDLLDRRNLVTLSVEQTHSGLPDGLHRPSLLQLTQTHFKNFTSLERLSEAFTVRRRCTSWTPPTSPPMRWPPLWSRLVHLAGSVFAGAVLVAGTAERKSRPDWP